MEGKIKISLCSVRAKRIIKRSAAFIGCIIAMPVILIIFIKTLLNKSVQMQYTGAAGIFLMLISAAFYLFTDHISDHR